MQEEIEAFLNYLLVQKQEEAEEGEVITMQDVIDFMILEEELHPSYLETDGCTS